MQGRFRLYIFNRKSVFIKIAALLVVFFVSAGDLMAASESDSLNQTAYSDNTNSVFHVSPLFDGIMLGSGAVVYAAYFLCDKTLKLNQTPFPNQVLNRNEVNSFDRLLMAPYSHSCDIAGTLVGALAVASPAVFAILPSANWLDIGVMYAETLLFTYDLKCFGKFIFSRPRPYMYFEGYPYEEAASGDWDDSFPSAHTAFTFASAAFTTYVFNSYFPDSPWRFAVAGGVYAIAAGTAALRICSGNHFMTDVLAGAAIGSLCGFLIPWLHITGLTSFSTTALSSPNVQSVGVCLVPSGFMVDVKFR